MEYPFIPVFWNGPWVWISSFLFVLVGIPSVILAYSRRSRKKNQAIDDVLSGLRSTGIDRIDS